MYRCSSAPNPRAPGAAAALLAVALACAAAAAPAVAQVQRVFPASALRGEIVFGQPPEIELNGGPARLAPGARIRNEQNMLELSGGLAGRRAVVHYTVEASSGLLMDVWLLRPDEAARRPWPRTADEAARWTFDPVAQTWSRR
jgi:hypothetical protein